MVGYFFHGYRISRWRGLDLSYINYNAIDYPCENAKNDQHSVFSSSYLHVCTIVKICAEKKETISWKFNN